MRRASRTPLAVSAALTIALSGCTVPPAANAPVDEQLVGALVDGWFVGGAARICPHDVDPGFTPGLPPCDDWLSVGGVTPEEFRARLMERGSAVRTEEDVDIVPAFVIGTVAGRSFSLVSVDPDRYGLPIASATPDPAPSSASDAEKDASIRSQTLPQPEGCSAPSDGWSSMSGVGLEPAVEYQRSHPDAVLGVSSTLVGHDTEIALVAVAADADPDTVASELGATYVGSLCVLRSEATADDLRRVTADDVLTSSESVLVSTLERPSETRPDDPRPLFSVVVTHLTDAVVERAAEYPEGLVELRPWFEPVSAD